MTEQAITRNRAPEPSDEAIESAIRALVSDRAPRTLCPSEVARSLAGDEDGWRALMPRVRERADALAAEGRIAVTQRGTVVEAANARGPVRLGPPAGGPLARGDR